MAAARSGEQAAFAALYQQNLRTVRALARRVLHTRDVDDVCQEVFLRAFLGIGGFAGASSFRTWISRITMNECLRVLRRYQQATNGGCHLTPLDEAAGAVDDALARLPDQLDLERLLCVLSPTQRQAVEMAYLEEMPAAEIAETLGTTVGQVKSTLHRAKGRMRKHL